MTEVSDISISQVQILRCLGKQSKSRGDTSSLSVTLKFLLALECTYDRKLLEQICSPNFVFLYPNFRSLHPVTP